MDAGGRIASGTAIESNAGAIADNTQQAQHKSIFTDNNEDKPLQASISKKHTGEFQPCLNGKQAK
ncbi:MAG: hypothetical protein ACXV8O_11365 [Methylobacter sp.]